MPPFTPRPFLVLGSLLFAATSYGQAPQLTASTPARNASVARTGAVELTFSQPVNGTSGLRLFGNQWRGGRTGVGSGDGTTTLRFQPTQAFAPGEQLMLTIPANVQSTSGTPLSGGGQVIGFRAAAGPATGTFSGTTGYGFSASSNYNPTLADVNNDGKLDFLVASTNPNGVDLRLGDGRGSFGGSTLINQFQEPQRLVVADINHDGNPDLIVASGGPTYALSIALGTGTGTFGPVSRISANGPVQGLRAGDVNGDGNLDLVFAVIIPFAGPWGPASSTLTVLLGNGQGSFTPGSTLALNLGNTDVHLQDLNNDGYLDCVTGSSNVPLSGPATKLLTPYLGNGRGTFTAVTTGTAVGGGTFGVLGAKVADLTGDGVNDLVVPDEAAGSISLHPGTGQGDFGAATATFAAPNATEVATADVNGDGNLDILASNSVSGTVSIWVKSSSSYQASTIPTTGIRNMALGDLNGDGTLDLVALDFFRAGGQIFSLNVRLNQPLAAAPTITAFSPASGPAGTVVTLSGSNFTGATAVLVGGVSVAFTTTPAGTLTFAVPAGIPHGLISVITPVGTATSAQAFSLVLASRTTAAALPATVFPNPARHAAQVQLPAGTGPVQLSLHNPLGQLVRQLRLTPGANGRLSLDLHGLAPALYTLKLQTAAHSTTQRLVVE